MCPAMDRSRKPLANSAEKLVPANNGSTASKALGYHWLEGAKAGITAIDGE
jgi:hypothetical protein